MKNGQGSKAKSVTWTYVAPGHFKTDYFPNVAGPKGSVDKQPKQMQVRKLHKYRGKEDDLLTAFLLLCQGGCRFESCRGDH